MPRRNRKGQFVKGARHNPPSYLPAIHRAPAAKRKGKRKSYKRNPAMAAVRSVTSAFGGAAIGGLAVLLIDWLAGKLLSPGARPIGTALGAFGSAFLATQIKAGKHGQAAAAGAIGVGTFLAGLAARGAVVQSNPPTFAAEDFYLNPPTNTPDDFISDSYLLS